MMDGVDLSVSDSRIGVAIFRFPRTYTEAGGKCQLKVVQNQYEPARVEWNRVESTLISSSNNGAPSNTFPPSSGERVHGQRVVCECVFNSARIRYIFTACPVCIFDTLL